MNIDAAPIRHKVVDSDTSIPDIHQDTYSKTVLGFWMYLMTDCILFGTIFVTYAVLREQTFGGPGPKELFSLPLVFAETMTLLISSVTCGLAVLSAIHEKPKWVLLWLGMTVILGAIFASLEFMEFAHLVKEGNSWQRSAFLSGFFTLVSTHGLHILFGLLWALVMIGQVIRYGVSTLTFRRLVLFSMFWHFLDLIWIFIFTFVYLLGVA